MSYERNKIIGLLYRIFQAEEWTWASLHTPSYKDMEKAIKDLEQSAYKAGEAESGRIRVVYDKQSKLYEYYLNLGYD